MNDFQRIALVTGAGSGIGQSAALALLKNDFKVVLCGRNYASLEKTKSMAEDNAGNAMVQLGQGQPPGSRPERLPVRKISSGVAQ
jgi:NADP-dependent 3-hydroxy acid dehydrogenase YdfG